jgi:hypothetical protein
MYTDYPDSPLSITTSATAVMNTVKSHRHHTEIAIMQIIIPYQRRSPSKSHHRDGAAMARRESSDFEHNITKYALLAVNVQQKRHIAETWPG